MVGGVEAEAGEQRVVVTIDLALLNRVLAIDEVSQTATVEAGIFGPELESRLGERGVTLGHYPQSFEFSTLGGWIATRSSGQNSLAYGGIEKLVESLRVVTPQGAVETLHVPRRADGPDVGQMLIGSEGIYGVIVSATVRIRRATAAVDYFMYAFKDFADGVTIARQLVQRGAAPPSCVSPTKRRRPLRSRWAVAAGGPDGEMPAGESRKNHRVAARTVGHPAAGHVHATDRPGGNARRKPPAAATGARRPAWRVVRQSGADPRSSVARTHSICPYLRDELMDNHLLVDTLETATTWNRLFALYAAVHEAIHRAAAQAGEPIVVFTHVSHLYRDGASLYFSLLGRQKRADPIGQWWTIKRAAGDAIRAQGAVIGHHHGVGQDHRANGPRACRAANARPIESDPRPGRHDQSGQAVYETPPRRDSRWPAQRKLRRARHRRGNHRRRHRQTPPAADCGACWSIRVILPRGPARSRASWCMADCGT